MDSYAIYRLADWDWINIYKQKMGVSRFHDYVNDVYGELIRMKVGNSFSLESNVKEENRELFIKIVCMFIQEGNPDYEFSKDYKYVIRHEKTTMVGKPRRNPLEKPGEKDVQGDRETAG